MTPSDLFFLGMQKAHLYDAQIFLTKAQSALAELCPENTQLDAELSQAIQATEHAQQVVWGLVHDITSEEASE